MKILIIGSGGREHAIAVAFSKSNKVSKIYFTGENVGMEEIAESIKIDVKDNVALVAFAIREKIDLTFVGPEVPLMNGIVDEFIESGLKIFGPTKKAANIEGSKLFAKELMDKYDIPTALYQKFTEYELAHNYIKAKGVPIVIKYDGLAAGKGVVVATTFEEANEALKDMLLDSKYGDARVVVEDFLDGIEFSLMAFVNGDKVYPLEIAQDHKRAYDFDEGPNTGGMGAYSPVPMIANKYVEEAITNIMIPTAKAMVSEGMPFVGILYGGLILTSQGVKVIEFNARFGDPETEVVLPRLKNDFYDVVNAVLEKKDVELEFIKDTVVGVVLAANGYPNTYEKGHILDNVDTFSKDVYHMGTMKKDDQTVSNGGRVLFVIGKGKELLEAQKNVYSMVKKVANDNLFYRKDIGEKSLK